jgi:hypothetical protein
MNPGDKRNGDVLRYRQVVALQEQALKFLQNAHLEPEVMQTYKAVLHYLRTRSDEQIEAMLGRKSKTRQDTSRTPPDADLTDEQIGRMTLDEVADRIESKSSSRRLIERIAACRFGVTKGAISGLHGRAALVEKILTLIRNERAHASIVRAVDETVRKGVR